ncbi:MAG: N-6 DNA methylase [Bryobacterales bacterium]|nr:N-6 DNA methylase [Bryobacterales bacterium]
MQTEAQLLSIAVALGAASIRSVSPEENRLHRKAASRYDTATCDWLRQYIAKGNDPLGEAFCKIRSPELRRDKGATYTPPQIVEAMILWAKGRNEAPARVVDPGVGSGRFLVAAAKAFPRAELIGVDIDPLASTLARANLAAHGLAERATILCGDYRGLNLPDADGRTLYIGNPPYVRHHLLEAGWKDWLTKEAEKRGYAASQLAGLHVHFFLATLLKSKPGDFGSFITSAEWLDVNYGKLIRQMFLSELGGQGLAVIEPTASPFADAATTAVVSTFEIGSTPRAIRVKRVSSAASLAPLEGGRLLLRGRLERQARWSCLTRRSPSAPAGYVELGELCRVHRGQVTGSNRIWIAGPHSAGLPESVLFRTVTKAKELFSAGGVLADNSGLRDVIDLPGDLSVFSGSEKAQVEAFLRYAKEAGAADGYVAGNRRAWWSVGLRSPAPILATYMARRPPAFVRNLASARHINIAHGLYPREPLGEDVLDNLAEYLSTSTSVQQGRTYAGGLTKFEPREMERILVPSPEALKRK